RCSAWRLPSVAGAVAQFEERLARRYSPPREEAWLRHQKNGAKPPKRRRRGGGSQDRYRLCARPPRPLLIRLLRDILLEVASTPPHEEGSFPALQRSATGLVRASFATPQYLSE